MMHFPAGRFLATLILAITAFAASPARAPAAGLELYMIEQRGCVYCGKWEHEVAEAYANSPEGARAPLRRLDLRAAVPEGVTFASRPVFTPTFILVEDGTELGRIEGYLSAAFFWEYLGVLLEKAAAPTH